MKKLADIIENNRVGLEVRKNTFQTMGNGKTALLLKVIKYETLGIAHEEIWQACYRTAVGDMQRLVWDVRDWQGRF